MIDTDFYNDILTMQEEQVRGYKTSFLPTTEPCLTLDTPWQDFTSTVTQLPELIRQKTLSEYVESLQLPNISQLHPDHYGRVKLLLGIMAQAYVWQPVHDQHGASPRSELPAVLAKPLVQVSALLNEAPIFNYADYVLRNWQRKNPDSPITIDNLEPLITFSDTDSERAFIVVHVAYEAIAGEAIRLSQQLQSAMSDNHAVDLVIQHLNAMTTVLTYLHKTFLHVRDIVSPEVFRDKIRLFLKGWKNITPMTYEDTWVDANQLRGETGAMSSVLPYFDALLGIFEPGFESRPALDSIPREGLLMAVNEYKDFRHYMPAPAQRLIQTVEDQATVRQFVTQHQSEPALIDAYNAAINSIVLMRSAHVSTVGPYIGTGENNKGFKAYGTGGSDYSVYLNALKSISESTRL